jgi:cytoskeleton protein RodZ
MRLLTPDLVISSLVIIGLFGFAVWSAAQVSAIQQDTPAEPSLIAISNLMLTVSPEPGEKFLPAANIHTGATAVCRSLRMKNRNRRDQPTLPVLGDAPLQVYVIANQRAFLRVVTDNKEVFNGRVVPGSAYPFSAKDQIELTTGNAAALQVFYNQEDLGILGSLGQVVRLFRPRRYDHPHPSASATASPTLPSTATTLCHLPLPPRRQ